MSGLTLDDIIARLDALPADERAEVTQLAKEATKNLNWVPNPGPQTTAYFSQADQLLYGGEAGGGKTDLIIGLSLQEHMRSLLLRRYTKDVSWLVDRSEEILDTREGYNGQDNRWTIAGKVIDYGGVQHPGDEQRFKGRPKDLIGFDEASDFLESQVEFIIGWLRTTVEEQRCRVVFATNPPTAAEGEWIVRWFAPWVDKTHVLFPYEMGKLLWTCRGPEDEWLWFEAPEDCEDEIRYDKNTSEDLLVTRTFIRSGLGDNPDLAKSGYGRQLALMPEELRKRYRDGDFTVDSEDNEFQIIPTDWIRAAQDRWIDNDGERMEALGVDIAQGGKDKTVIAPRWTGKTVKHWVGRLHKYPGVETPNGAEVAARIIVHHRHAAQVNLDMGGGYGGATYEKLQETEMSVLGFVPGGTSLARTQDGLFGFLNKRAEAIWRVREMLSPEAEEKVALPPDPMLRADLASFRRKPGDKKVHQVEAKEDIKKRLGRSTDDGDAVVLSLATGDHRQQPRKNSRFENNRQKTANMGRPAVRRRMSRR